MTVHYLEKIKMPNNQAVLDEMVDAFVDMIYETEARVGNIHVTIKKRAF